MGRLCGAQSSFACSKTPAIFSSGLRTILSGNSADNKAITSTVADQYDAAALISSFSSYAFGPSFTPLAPNDANTTSQGGVIQNDLWRGEWNFQIS
jgi:hypothetical protein